MISGLILAGGQGSRLDGQDKGLVTVASRPMIEHVIERFAPQVDHLAISANRNVDRYHAYGYPVLVDEIEDYAGPLAGFLAGLRWCPGAALAIVPCDCPALSPDIVASLSKARNQSHADIAYAVAESRPQPVFALVAKHLGDSLEAFLASGERKIGRWYAEQSIITVDFGDEDLSFMNVNTETERRLVESRLTNQ